MHISTRQLKTNYFCLNSRMNQPCRIQRQGAYLTAQQLLGRDVYPLNCSAHPQYLMESKLDVVVDDLL